MEKLNKQEECLARYFYDLIKSGKGYKLRSYTDYQAKIVIPKKWFWHDVITLSSIHNNQWGFTINSDVVIHTDLAYEAIQILKERNKYEGNEKYYRKVAKWYKKFDCGTVSLIN